MDTITDNSTATITANAESVRELLAGAATQAHTREDLPAINAVKLYSESGRLYAVATDRYRLIEGSIEGEIEGELAATVLRLSDIKRILELLKEKRLDRMPVQINRVGDMVSVAVAGNSATVQAWECSYPPHAQLFQAGEPVAVSEIAFNPGFFADYSKIEKLAGRKSSAGVKVSFYGDKKPIGIHLNGDKVSWRALLMPMRTA
jgi:DNA polymerase III sliding clamp (beta) subunit (PCNA family)